MGTESRQILSAIDKKAVAGAMIQPASCLKSLGIIVYSTLLMDKHVNSICTSSNYHICALHVRSTTSADVANNIACNIINT